MAKLRVHNFSLSLDGYGAGVNQSVDDPLGVRGEELHEWVTVTRFFHEMTGEGGGTTGLDDEIARRGDVGIGATVMGRNMFGPIRGEWPDESWRGWWGDEPPYHHDVFVLTHYERDPVEMEGGTTFYFVTDGIHAALDRAFDAAGGRDVRLGGGVATIQEYLRAGLVDELHLAIVPVLLGRGERFFDHLDDGPVGYECVELVSTPAAVHARLARAGTASS
jgi:dihydrofolate reductase